MRANRYFSPSKSGCFNNVWGTWVTQNTQNKGPWAFCHLGSCAGWVPSSPPTPAQEQPQNHTLVSQLWAGHLFLNYISLSLFGKNIPQKNGNLLFHSLCLKETVEWGWPSSIEQCRKTGCSTWKRDLTVVTQTKCSTLLLKKKHFHCLMLQWKKRVTVPSSGALLECINFYSRWILTIRGGKQWPKRLKTQLTPVLMKPRKQCTSLWKGINISDF